MGGTVEMTEYTFNFSKTITVRLQGKNTGENCTKAIKEAMRQANIEIYSDWLIDIEANEYTEYESDYEGISHLGGEAFVLR
jgi:hypothetical protein